MTSPASGGGGRIETIDAVRGFAVCGILIMNIVAMGLPAYAYIDPFYYGGAEGADRVAWAAAYIVADGKMRALFTMLFGASMALIADRAEGRTPGPAATHYRRLAWLFVFGMLHAWGLWYGDILVVYALAGALGFAALRWPTSLVLYTAAGLFALLIALDLVSWHDLAALRDAATAPGAPAIARDSWAAVLHAAMPSDATTTEIALYRGSVADAFAARAPMTRLYQTTLLPTSLLEALCFMLFGLALYRSGFLSGRWPRWAYRALLAAGYLVALPLHGPIARLLLETRFDPPIIPLASALSLLLRPWVALAHASLVILFVTSGRGRWLAVRVAAAGRMAFTNYIGSTLIATTLFYGYGFGLFGALSRAELYGVVAAIWAAILLGSKPWLDRFAYGPFEWLWRSLARGTPQPFRRFGY
jgi:uncharacterized protein